MASQQWKIHININTNKTHTEGTHPVESLKSIL